MTRALRLFLFVIPRVVSVCAADLTQDDYDIWHAALREHDARRVIYVWHLVEPLDALQRITFESALKDFPEARPTAATWRLEPAEFDIEQLQAAAERRPQR